MTSPHRELYQEVILDHGKRPRNRRSQKNAMTAEGYNPLCGDRVTVFVRVEGGVLVDVSFEGEGCAISTASASMMTSALKGKTVQEAKILFDRFRHAVTEQGNERSDLGKLAVFEGVREFPSRVKCATLAWHTLRGALDQAADIVTSE